MTVTRKDILSLIITLGICFTMTACSSLGVRGEKRTMEPERPQRVQEDKIHEFGEAVPLLNPTPQDPKRIGAEYTIKSATLYNTPEEAGLDRNHLLTGEEQRYDLATEMPSPLDVSKTGFLLCDINVKNIYSEYMNITALTLVHRMDSEQKLKMVGYPAYFAKPEAVEDSTDYYNFNLPVNQSMDAQVGWWVDLEQCKKENLYLMFNHGGDKEYQEYWELGL